MTLDEFDIDSRVGELIEDLIRAGSDYETLNRPARDAAIESLAALGLPAVPQLIEALADPRVLIRHGIGGALRRIGPACVYDLAAALRHPDPEARFHAALVIYGIGEQVSDAVPALADALTQDTDLQVRQYAAVALERMGRDAEPAVDALIQALGDPADIVREWAANALRSIGAAAEPALDSLTLLLIDEEPAVRQAAAEAIDYIERGSAEL